MQIQQLISDFRIKQQQLSTQVDLVFRGEYLGSQNPSIGTPCLTSSLIHPIVKEMALALPELCIDVKTELSGGCYKIYNKDKIAIGRLSCQLDKNVRVFYANVDGNIFEEDQEFSSLVELVVIIKGKIE